MDGHYGDGGTGEVCHVETAISVVGGKWKLLIVRLLIFRGPSRFNALARLLPDISNKVLTENLRELQESDIVIHEADAAGHKHYSLSEVGAELMPILKALGDWSQRHSAPARDRGEPQTHEIRAQGEL